jgi:hypothetical protein
MSNATRQYRRFIDLGQRLLIADEVVALLRSDGNQRAQGMGGAAERNG